MTRQNIYPDTEHRLFEAFMDFSGGLNSEISNERLKPSEYPILQNVDLISRASAKRRTGRTLLALMFRGTSQGMFPFFRSGQSGPDIIAAVRGKLYVLPNGATTATQIAVTDGGSPFVFQQSSPVEAVQYQGLLFVATGTKLVEVSYDTNTATFSGVTVTPYTPTVLEAIYIGTNGLATNPYSYVADGVAPTISVVGIQPQTRTGAVNIDLPLTAYIAKPAGVTSIDYQWEYKKSSDAAWAIGRAWTTGTPGKTWNLNVPTATTYDVRVSIRDTAVPATVYTYILSSYQINLVASKTNNDLPYSGIQSCRKIRLHWDRILLAGDATNGFQMYVSDLQNPRFFPVTNTISYDTGKQETVNAIVQFQTYLVVMTNTTIQTLLGKDPSDYQRNIIHDSIGCVAPLSAKVVGNQVIFKSFEGIMSLKPNPYRIDTMSVQRIDQQIKSEVPADIDACSLFYNNQYWLCFPQKQVIYRFYFEFGVWSKDISTDLSIRQFFNYGTTVYNLKTNGDLTKHDDTVYADSGIVYDMIVETKLHDLSASFNNKKLRRLYVIAKHYDTTPVNLSVKVYADAAIVLTPDVGTVTIDANNNAVWSLTSAPNFHFYAGTKLGTWILGKAPLGNAQLSVQRASVHGKCRRVKINFKHSEAVPCEIYGLGVEFKLKKP